MKEPDPQKPQELMHLLLYLILIDIVKQNHQAPQILPTSWDGLYEPAMVFFPIFIGFTISLLAYTSPLLPHFARMHLQQNWINFGNKLVKIYEGMHLFEC